ncbi:deoxycytidylate deaminase [Ordospora colligata]|uniref:Deoxycytidylate deaminase n=1 Tax=Ordospora colligata OC4 TaxID=1354746 RepID=A0A0B2UIX7_9MICR|nr:deoxycytidylate deaminase [Ordospora colligata OC4]KHN69012.1 deoxycytidylate deaminase [Ordospora colligata OC4]TBU14240.1 deoxycytidylate deaminase [Ordospora colligata]TBU14287.1 deoxycytidylate deaminase [Ordospora colligata]TBU17917.1 deoxycytidylate deaminase [Ordospora colligata]
MHEVFMSMAFEQAVKAFELQEVPVGCVVVKDNKIVSSSHNMTNANKSPLEHAEVLCIRSTDCSNSTFYITCEPCIMCMGIISRLSNVKVYYGCKNEVFGSKTICGIGDNTVYIPDERCFKILQKFYTRENIFAPEEKRKVK